MKDYSIDSIWSKDVKIVQSKKGYRFALDAVLLAHFIRIGPHEEALEIGTGNGVIPVLLSRLQEFKRVVAVEIQKELAELARQNVDRNGLVNVEILEADIKQLENVLPAASFDLIFSNPPYRKTGSGKLNPNPEKAIARHEVKFKLQDLFECAEKFLKKDGRISVILPTFRKKDSTNLVRQYQFVCLEKRRMHSFAQDPPVFLLATLCRRDAGGTKMHPPLVIYESSGIYTREMQHLLSEDSTS